VGGSISFNGTYQPLTGTITVTTNNSAAFFTISGPATYVGSGASFTQVNAPLGTYHITFGSVPKYIAPTVPSATLTASQPLTFKGNYTPITVSVCPLTSTTCLQSLSFTYRHSVAGPPAPQQIAVASNAPALQFTVTIVSSPTGWLSVNLPTHVTPATMWVNVDPNKDLKVGTYIGYVTISSNDATNSPAVISVLLTVTSGPSVPAPDCLVHAVRIETKASAGVLEATSSPTGHPCEYIITLGNPKPYWTNFAITSSPSVTVQAVGGKLNLYDTAHVLPPKFPILPNPPTGDPASYRIVFTRSGEIVTVLADPESESGDTAVLMNLVQGLLDLLPGGSSSVTLTIDGVSRIAAAINQMPHLRKVGRDIFQKSPNLTAATRDFLIFFSSSELTKFNQLLVELGSEIVFDVATGGLRYIGQLVAAIIGDFETVFDLTFGTPVGSITFAAE
jgi:hypothetical protein